MKKKAVIARHAIGVGDGFSLTGFQFARTESFNLASKVFFPNPFGLIILKRASYLNDPNRRIKDFADIIELVNGLVENATHYELDGIWNKLSRTREAEEIKEILNKATNLESIGNWDLENIRNELLKRSFGEEFIETTLIQRLQDFLEILK